MKNTGPSVLPSFLLPALLHVHGYFEPHPSTQLALKEFTTSVGDLYTLQTITTDESGTSSITLDDRAGGDQHEKSPCVLPRAASSHSRGA